MYFFLVGIVVVSALLCMPHSSSIMNVGYLACHKYDTWFLVQLTIAYYSCNAHRSWLLMVHARARALASTHRRTEDTRSVNRWQCAQMTAMSAHRRWMRCRITAKEAGELQKGTPKKSKMVKQCKCRAGQPMFIVVFVGDRTRCMGPRGVRHFPPRLAFGQTSQKCSRRIGEWLHENYTITARWQSRATTNEAKTMTTTEFKTDNNRKKAIAWMDSSVTKSL